MRTDCIYGMEAVQVLQECLEGRLGFEHQMCSSRVKPSNFDVVMLHCRCVLLEMHTVEHAVQLLSYPLSADLFHQSFSYLQAAYSTC